MVRALGGARVSLLISGPHHHEPLRQFNERLAPRPKHVGFQDHRTACRNATAFGKRSESPRWFAVRISVYLLSSRPGGRLFCFQGPSPWVGRAVPSAPAAWISRSSPPTLVGVPHSCGCGLHSRLL